MRSKKTLRNVMSNVIFNFIIAFLGFAKIKVFMKGFSTDLYSLHQLFYQIFAYFTIADIGFGLVINKNLYKAFAKKDKNEINKIYVTSRKFYNILGSVLLLFSVLFSFFVNNLTKAKISIPYMQIMFISVITLNVIDYFFEAPKGIITADEKLYEVNYLIKGAKVLTTVIQIALVLLKLDYIIIMLASIIFNLIINLYMNQKILKKYPYLQSRKKDKKAKGNLKYNLKENNKFHKEYLKGTKDLIPSKLSGVLNSNTDIVLISTFISPLMVNIYSSYNYIVKFITDTTYIMASAIVPSFAAEINNNKEKSYKIFEEINLFFLFLACFVNIMLYLFLNPLIKLWIGEEYLVANITLILFITLGFQTIIKRGMDIVINSKGYFKETKKPVFFEALVNLVLSLALIKPLGMNGVLIGSVLSIILTTYIFHPIFIYKKVFNKTPTKFYIRNFVAYLISVILASAFALIKINTIGIGSFILNVLIYAIIVLIILFIIFYLIFKPMRDLSKRGKNLAINILKIRSNDGK